MLIAAVKMVRKYKITVRQKPYARYSENQIQLALADLKNGLSFRAYSKKQQFIKILDIIEVNRGGLMFNVLKTGY